MKKNCFEKFHNILKKTSTQENIFRRVIGFFINFLYFSLLSSNVTSFDKVCIVEYELTLDRYKDWKLSVENQH